VKILGDYLSMATRLPSAKCPQCGRTFVSKGALKQHVTALHSSVRPVRALRAPKASVSAGMNKISGSDIIAVVDFKTDHQVGKVLFRQELSPQVLSGTRLAAHSKLWNRWRPVSLKISVVTGSSTLVGGTYVMGWTASTNEQLSGTVASLQKVAAFKPSLETNLFSPAALAIPSGLSNQTHRWYECKSLENEDSCHGTFAMVVASRLQGLTGVTSVGMRIHLDWSVEFDSPEIPDDANVIGLYAPDDYTPYFTDSVSDWVSGTVLTLKHTQGGSVVPFAGLTTHVVYKLDPKAKLTYYEDSTKTGQVKYGALIWDYTVPGLAVFSSLEDAKEYARSGDSSKCLPYKKAGPFVTPENPAWFIEAPAVAASQVWRYAVEDGSSDKKIKKILDRLDNFGKELSSFKKEFKKVATSVVALSGCVNFPGTEVAGVNVYAIVDRMQALSSALDNLTWSSFEEAGSSKEPDEDCPF